MQLIPSGISKESSENLVFNRLHLMISFCENLSSSGFILKSIKHTRAKIYHTLVHFLGLLFPSTEKPQFSVKQYTTLHAFFYAIQCIIAQRSIVTYERTFAFPVSISITFDPLASKLLLFGIFGVTEFGPAMIFEREKEAT